MKKIIIIFYAMLFILLPTLSNEEKIYDVFSLNFKDTQFHIYNKELFINPQNKYNYMIYLCYSVLIKNTKINIFIYLRPKKTVNIENLKRYTEISNISNASTDFGLANEYEIILNNKENIKEFTTNKNVLVKYFVSYWPGMMTRDILVYYFDIKDNPLFDACMVEFFNLWPESEKYPEDFKRFNTEYIEDLIAKNDKRVDIYKFIYEVMKDIKFYNLNNSISINKYTPKITNLRFRETPDLKGKFIRSLIKGEKLELIEKGNSETINGLKGIWVKVKTEKGEIGWCFDAYLEEVKEK